MRHWINLSIIFFSFFLLSKNLSAEKFNVMLHLKKGLQTDTLGLNLIEHLLPLAYTQIMNGNATLWDSPQKQTQINAQTLQRIENSSQTSFIFSNDLFILEQWNVSNKKIKITSLGFFFINNKIKGEQISYGYVELKDIKNILISTPIPTNANGFNNFTFWQAIINRKFEYNIVQFGNTTVQNFEQSDKIKKNIFTSKKYVISDTDYKPFNTEKLINYSIKMSYDTTSSNIDLANNSNYLLQTINAYLHENLEEFFNLGGYNIASHLDKEIVFIVTGVDIEETWKKENDGSIKYLSDNFVIWLNETLPLKSLDLTEIAKWELSVNQKSLSDYIKEKSFLYTINKINTQEISNEQADAFKQALQKYNWSRLSEYVKYY